MVQILQLVVECAPKINTRRSVLLKIYAWERAECSCDVVRHLRHWNELRLVSHESEGVDGG